MTYNKKLDVNNIQSLEDVKNVFKVMNLISNIQKENEDYEILSKYFTLPYEAFKFELVEEPRKSLEEIQKELEEKIDKLIEDTKRNFYGSKIYADGEYERKFDRIFDNFTYAKENGVFPLKYTLSGTFDYSKLSVSGGVNIGSPSFVIKQSNNHEGYYTIGEDKYYRFYMEKKPNIIFRFFVYKLMGFKWVNEK